MLHFSLMNQIEIELLLFIYFLKNLPLDYGKDVYKVEYLNDESCDCECKIKQENCLASQTYDALNCLCKCVETDCPTDKQVIIKIFFIYMHTHVNLNTSPPPYSL